MPTDPNDEQAGLVGEDALIAEFWAPLAEGYRGALGLKDDCAIVAVPATLYGPGSDTDIATAHVRGALIAK